MARLSFGSLCLIATIAAGASAAVGYAAGPTSDGLTSGEQAEIGSTGSRRTEHDAERDVQIGAGTSVDGARVENIDADSAATDQNKTDSAKADSARAGNATFDELTMVVGDTASLTLPPDADVRVTRRGIIDLFHTGGGRWLLTALRTGIVVLTAAGDPNVADGPRRIVRVVPRGASGDESDAPVPEWICRSPGASCDRSARIVAGRFRDASRFAQARQLCLQGSCRFDATLAEGARRTWEDKLRALAPPLSHLSLSSSGVVRLSVDCQPAAGGDTTATRWSAEGLQGLRATLRPQLDERDVTVTCAAAQRVAFRLETKILRIARSQLAALGFDGTATLGFAARPWKIDAVLTRQLAAARRDRAVEIVGEPALRLVAGRRGEAHSGGEFPVALHATRTDEPHSTWKPYGLSLAATAWASTPGTAILAYELALSSRDGDGVSAQSVRGEIALPLGTPTIAAALDLSSTDREARSQPWAAHLPIVGPLFRLDAAGEQSSRVLAWFKLSADTGTELRDGDTSWPADAKRLDRNHPSDRSRFDGSRLDPAPQAMPP